MSSLDHHDHPATDEHKSDPIRRGMHFVGSLPAALCPTARAGMQWILDHAGTAAVTALPSDRDPRWITDWLVGLRARGAWELIVDGDCSGYDRMPIYRVRHGYRLTAADVAPHRVNEAAAAFAARRQLSAPELPPYQVSMPAPLDLALVAFGVPAALRGRTSPLDRFRVLRRAVRALPVFTGAVAEEIEQIAQLARDAADEVVVQLESPAVMHGFEKVPRPWWPAVTAWMAQQTAALICQTPRDVGLALHIWCRGDLAHEPMSTLTDLRPMVAVHNAVAARLVHAGRPVPAAHVAFCDGRTAPSTSPAKYHPLSSLRDDIQLLAGVADETHPEASTTALRLIEHALGRPVSGVGAACGLGRRTPEDAASNVALTWRLTRLPRPGRTPT
ncbi:hypothetical protein L3Q67_25705 [Saccharothrix sp. AJ9571]|nr:hypothetical protein L3Q67_25705 [Saccharothrix sp. AJ9571]